MAARKVVFGGDRLWRRFAACLRLQSLGLAACLTVLPASGSDTGAARQLEAAQHQMSQFRYTEALHTADALLGSHPGYRPALLLRARVLLESQRVEEAQQALASAPKDAESELLLGDIRARQMRIEEAEAAFLRASTLAPGDIRPILARARVLQSAGRFQESLQAAAKIRPAPPAALLPILAADYTGLHDMARASVEIRRMLNLASAEPNLVPEFAMFLLNAGAMGDADQVLRLAARRQSSTAPRFLFVTARTRTLQGRRADARLLISQALAAAPQYLDALLAGASLAAQDSDWDSAARYLNQALTVSLDNVSMLKTLAQAQLYGHRQGDALLTVNRLEALRPGDLEVRRLAALALAGLSRWNEAEVQAEAVLADRPDDDDMHRVLGAVFFNLSDFARARNHLDRCLARHSDDAGTLYYQGLLEKAQGNVDAAVRLLSTSLRINPDNAAAQSAIGGLYLQRGDVPEAILALERAVRLDPVGAEAHYRLSQAYAKSGATAKARQELDTYRTLMRMAEQHPSPAADKPRQD